MKTLYKCLITFMFCWSFLLAGHGLQPAPISSAELSGEAWTNSDTADYFTVSENNALAYYHYVPNGASIATMIFIHGGGAHSQAGYQHLARTLSAEYRVEVYLLDLRGHGKSFGRRGDSPTAGRVLEDIRDFVLELKSNTRNPIYLAGHSSGAGLVLNYSSWDEKEAMDGYFFIAPELGYKSKTKQEDHAPFARVSTHKFIINSMSGGRLLGNSYAVHFDNPQPVVDEQDWLVEKITVNMAKALTPSCPKNQFAQLDSPFGLFIGEEDELFDVQKVLDYANLSPSQSIVAGLIPGESHLSILVGVGHHIGYTVEAWQEI